MDAAQLVGLALTASILLLVFALGLGATFEEATYLLRRPAKFVRALLAMYVVVPAAAVLLAWVFNFSRPVEIALLATAVSPVPPILPNKQLKLGGSAAYVYGLLVAMSTTAIVFVPLAIEGIGWVFGRDAHINAVEVAKLVGVTVLGPLAAGLLVRRIAPVLAERVEPLASKVGGVLLVAGLLPILVNALPPTFALVGNGNVIAILALVVTAIGAGHWLGGPDPGERRSLAIAASMRHPGVALAIARLNFPGEILVPVAILMFVLLATIVTAFYGKHQAASA